MLNTAPYPEARFALLATSIRVFTKRDRIRYVDIYILAIIFVPDIYVSRKPQIKHIVLTNLNSCACCILAVTWSTDEMDHVRVLTFFLTNDRSLLLQ